MYVIVFVHTYIVVFISHSYFRLFSWKNMTHCAEHEWKNGTRILTHTQTYTHTFSSWLDTCLQYHNHTDIWCDEAAQAHALMSIWFLWQCHYILLYCWVEFCFPVVLFFYSYHHLRTEALSRSIWSMLWFFNISASLYLFFHSFSLSSSLFRESIFCHLDREHTVNER